LRSSLLAEWGQLDDGSKIIKVSDFGLVKLRDSSLTSKGSSIKGTLNDPALNIVGFKNYETRHEVYALAQVVNFILSGRKLGSTIKLIQLRNSS